MPDGDIIRGLKQLYQKPYEALYEVQASGYECARSLLTALKIDLRRKGDMPVQLAKSMANSLIQAINDSDELNPIDWLSLGMEFDRLKFQSDGVPELKELAVRAGKFVLNNFRYQKELGLSYASELILRQYMTEVYESSFKEAIPLPPEATTDINTDTLQQRIKDTEPYILDAIRQWAKKTDRSGHISAITLPARSKSQLKPIDMDEDLSFS